MVSDLIVVAGSGRSGTTWLGNIIAGDDRRIIFEPFECRRVPEFVDLGLRPYFPSCEPFRQWHSVIAALCAGDIRNAWTDQDCNRLNAELDKGGVVIKEIRANGMLGWLSNNFPCKIVYVIRNPFDVVASRVHLNWETHIDAFLDQPQLMRDFLLPFTTCIAAAQSTIQKHAVMWCIENLIPLRQMAEQQWIFCRYEDLVAHPEAETSRILQRLDLELTPARLRALGELSRTCSPEKASSETDPVAARHLLSEEQHKEVREVLNAFSIDLYHGQL